MGAFGKGEGSHGGVWECPDLFPVKTEKGEKWVLLQNMDRGAVSGGSGTQYFVGSFDGSTYKNDNPPDKKKNLSNLMPHPIYSGFYYSHPTLLERERALNSAAQ